MVVENDAAALPSVDHSILAEPLSREHDAVVGLTVQVKDVVHAEFDAFVPSADVVVGSSTVFTRDRNVQVVTIRHHHVFTVEQIVQVFVTDVVVADLSTHGVFNVVHVIFANPSVIDADAVTVVES